MDEVSKYILSTLSRLLSDNQSSSFHPNLGIYIFYDSKTANSRQQQILAMKVLNILLVFGKWTNIQGLIYRFQMVDCNNWRTGMVLFTATIYTLVTGRMRDDCANDVKDNKKESQWPCLREQLYLCRIPTLFKWAFLPASKLKTLLSNLAFETFLNGYFFKLLFMYSLRKASQINNRYCLGSVYKQAPSRNLNCSLFVCLCFTAPGRHQTISLVLPSAEETEQRNP